MMKNVDILNAMNYIDDDLIVEAESLKSASGRKTRAVVISIAGGLLAAAAAAFLIFGPILDNSRSKSAEAIPGEHNAAVDGTMAEAVSCDDEVDGIIGDRSYNNSGALGLDDGYTEPACETTTAAEEYAEDSDDESITFVFDGQEYICEFVPVDEGLITEDEPLESDEGYTVYGYAGEEGEIAVRIDGAVYIASPVEG